MFGESVRAVGLYQFNQSLVSGNRMKQYVGPPYIVLNGPLGHRELDHMSSGSGGPSLVWTTRSSHPDWFLLEPARAQGNHTEDQQTF